MKRSLSRGLCALLSLALAGAVLPEPAAAAALGRGPARLAARPAGVRPGSFRIVPLRALPSRALPVKLVPVQASAAARTERAAARPAALPPVAAAARAVMSAPAAPAAARPAPGALASARGTVASLAAARRGGKAGPAHPLEELFEGASRRRDAPEPVVAAQASDSPGAGLAPAAARPRAEPGEPGAPGEPPPAPKPGWKRTLAAGLVGALGTIAVTLSIPAAAVLLGHTLQLELAPASIPSEEPSFAATATLFLGATVGEPLAEELLYRAGLFAGLSWLSRKLRLGAFWAPALLMSAFYAVTHESDPALMAARVASSMIFARLFHKEGLLAAMSAHVALYALMAFPFLALFAGWALTSLPPESAILVLLGLWGAAVYYGVKANRYLKSAGAAAVKPFEPRHGLAALALLLLSFLVLPTLGAVAAMLGLTVWLGARGVKALLRAARR